MNVSKKNNEASNQTVSYKLVIAKGNISRVTRLVVSQISIGEHEETKEKAQVLYNINLYKLNYA